MAFTGTSNGVGYSITPYVAVTTGPSNQAAQFQSGYGTGQSQPITITFDRDVIDFVIEVVGPSLNGNFVVGYDVNGNEVTRQQSPIPSAGQSDQAYRVEIQTTAATAFRAVHLIPAVGDYVAYRNLYLYSSASPYQAPPVTFTPGQGTSAVDLSQFLQISTNAVQRQYTRNSLIPLTPDTLQLRNLSQDLDMTVTCRGVNGVSFNPSVVDIPQQGSVSVEIDYDITQLNNLQDGVNVINAVFDITSDTPISNPIPTPTPAPTPAPVSGIPTDSWLEERFSGSPMGPIDQTPLATIYARPPILSSIVSTINYGDGTLVAPITVRWQGNWTFQNSTYQFTATVDDGMRVWIDGTLVLDQWSVNASRSFNFTQNMSAGQHNIRVEYFNATAHCAAIFGFNPVGSTTTYTPPVTSTGGFAAGGSVTNNADNLGGSWVFNNQGFFTQNSV